MLLNDLERLDLQDAERNAIIDDITMAKEINGNPDENQQMLKRILLSNSRQSLMMFKALHRLDSEHTAKCPVQQNMRVVDGKSVWPWDRKDQNTIKIPVLGIQASGNSAMYLGVGFAVAIVIVATAYLTTLGARNAIKEDLQSLKLQATEINTSN